MINKNILEGLILGIILLTACITDIKYMKIPNKLILTGILIGFLLHPSVKSIFSLLFLFFIGIIPLMGMGDLKLWMVMTLFLGLKNSSFIMFLSAILLILYGLVVHHNESMLILNHIKYCILLKDKPKIIEQTKYPFAPFIFTAYVLFQIGRCIV